ncbi:MAG: SLBB domain-containing protein [Prevotella sp.]|nr:SLBB domain-containing protein [Prevotella sp.]
MNKFSTLMACLLMMPLSLLAQAGMTDSQVIEYVKAEVAKGTSHDNIATELLQRGVSREQLQRLQRKYGSQQASGSSMAAGTQSRLRQANGEPRRTDTKALGRNQRRLSTPSGEQPYEVEKSEMRNAIGFMLNDSIKVANDATMQSEKPSRVIFGHNLFNNPNMTFESSMNIATPQNYLLGPGDMVIIDISGASQKSITETVSPDGTITVQDYGVIAVGGLSVSAAKSRIRSLLGERYQSSRIDLSLGQTRTITVSVVGEVMMPGTYTLSAFATVYNVLYMAGGPNSIGTLRSVKVYRKGKLLSNVDIYDFILNGKLSGDVRLQDNDIVTVGPYETLVNITGKVKRPMFYEMKSGESLGTLIKYAGGFTGDAYQKAVRVNRKSGSGYSVFNISEFDMSSFKLMDEDSVSVDSTLNRYHNMVEIRGAVFRPGMYQIGGDITTVKALVEAAAGLTENAISQHAVMHRMKPNRTLEVMSIDVVGIINGTTPDIPLRNEDVLFIASTEDLEEQKTVSIMGEVVYPGEYRYADNETLEDLVLQAGGPTEAASLVKVDVARRIIDPKGTEAKDTIAGTYTFQLKDGFIISGEQGFVLQPFDQVYVRKNPTYIQQQLVKVEGEVQFEGVYALSKKGQRLSEIIKQAGGLTSLGYAKGARLLRAMTPEEREQSISMLRAAMRNTGKDSIDRSKLEILREYPVGIELDKALLHPGTDADPVLRHGDRIVVPEYNNTVTVNGEVLYPNTVSFQKGKNAKYYIQQAGGYSATAKKNRTFIVYSNGMVAKASKSNKPEPGCQIVVPTKNNNKKLTLPEILAITSSTASLATMIATIANLLK